MKNVVKNGTKVIFWGAVMLGSVALSGFGGANLGKTLAEINNERIKGKA